MNLRKFQYFLLHYSLYNLDFFSEPSTIVPLLHRLNVCIFTLFKPLASFLYATWSSATFLASCSEPWTCGNFNTLIISITLQPVGLGLFTAPSTIVPSLHRLKPSIFKIFKPLASVSYATWSSATFLASCSEPWTCGNFNILIVSITLHPARFGFFTGPSSIVPSLHRQKVCIFTLFTPLALFSYATWSSTIFLASYSEPWIHGSFYYKHIIPNIWLQRTGEIAAVSTNVELRDKINAHLLMVGEQLFQPYTYVSVTLYLHFHVVNPNITYVTIITSITYINYVTLYYYN